MQAIQPGDGAGGSETGADAAPSPDPNGSLDATTLDGATETILGTLRAIWNDFLAHTPLLAGGLLVLVATLFAAAIIRRIARRLMWGWKVRGSLKTLTERFVALAAWVVGLLLAFMIIFPGLDPSDALAALGIGSIAIGLAFKDIFENLFAGVLILWRFPFENGDFIACEGVEGRVEDVTIRNTIIRTVSGELVVMPNAMIYKNAVEVLTNRSVRRITFICGVAYGEDVGEARSVIGKAAASCESVRSSHPIEIFAQEFADSSINFEVTWWTGATPLERRRSRDEVVEAVKRALDEAGIEIPFPQRSLWFKDGIRVRGAGDGGAEE